MSKRGRFERQKPKKKGGKIALIVLLVVVVLLIAGVVGGMLYYNHMLGKINQAQTIEKNPSAEELEELLGGKLPTLAETEETEATEAPTETTVPETRPMTAEDIVNVMVVGNSSRAGEDARLADTAILVTLNKYTKTVTLTSVFRDALVKGPKYAGHTCGNIKFTTVYALGYTWGDIGGAMECVNQTMLSNFGVNVDYNVEVDFDGFMAMVDKIGGVTLEITQEEADYLNEAMDNYLEAEAGYEYMDGYAALTYARMRKAKNDNDSDIKRTSRQRYLVEELIKTLMKKDLATINAAIGEVLPAITTNMSKEQINDLLMDVLPILPELKIESGTLPVAETYWGEMYDIYGNGNEQSVLRFVPEQQKKLMAPITEGVPAQ